MDLNHTRLPIPPHLHILLCVLVTASTLKYYSIWKRSCQQEFEKIFEVLCFPSGKGFFLEKMARKAYIGGKNCATYFTTP